MVSRTEKLLLALFIAALTAGAAATASETINYSYNSRGRLVRVQHSGTVNNNVSANYSYDKADNRTNVNVARPTRRHERRGGASIHDDFPRGGYDQLHSRFGFGRFLLAALVTCFAATVALGDTLVNTPAEKFAMAPGGVDLRTGHYVYNETDLSIGGDGGLTFSRTMPAAILAGHAMPFANLSHNWDIMILEMFVPPPDPNYSPGLVRQMTVHFGGRVQTYRLLGADIQYTQVSTGGRAPLTFSGSASNLNDASVVYTYQAADGTVMTFRPIGGGDCSDTYRCAYVSQIVEADGTTYSFDYASSGGTASGSARLQRVVSSRGYALLLEGSGHLVTKACVLNLALTALPAAGTPCRPMRPPRPAIPITATSSSPARPAPTIGRPNSPMPPRRPMGASR